VRELACLAAIVFVAAVLRLVALPARGGWDSDQGTEMLALRSALTTGHLPTFGPEAISVSSSFHHGALYYDLLLPAGPFPPSGRRTVIIERGESLRAIATELQRAGLLHSPVGFLVLARLMKLDRHVKAGQYAFRSGTTVPALLSALERGMFGLDLLTIPEGLTVREVGALLAPREVLATAHRLDDLLEERRFPMPDRNRPVVPWPPF